MGKSGLHCCAGHKECQVGQWVPDAHDEACVCSTFMHILGSADLGSNTRSANAHVFCYLLRKAGGQLLFEGAHVSRVGLFLHCMERSGFADAC